VSRSEEPQAEKAEVGEGGEFRRGKEEKGPGELSTELPHREAVCQRV
jgi:hypothetical protein